MARLLTLADEPKFLSLCGQAKSAVENAWPWAGAFSAKGGDLAGLFAQGYEGCVSDAGDCIFLWRDLRPVARGVNKGQKASELMIALLEAGLTVADFSKRGDEMLTFWFGRAKAKGLLYAWTELPRALGGKAVPYLDGARFLLREDFQTDELSHDATVLKAVSWSQYSCRTDVAVRAR